MSLFSHIHTSIIQVLQYNSFGSAFFESRFAYKLNIETFEVQELDL